VLLLRTTLLLACALSLTELPTLPTAVRWSVAVSATPATPPVIGGERVFIALQSGIVAAHLLRDGSELWHVELRAGQPVAADGARAFVAAGEAVHALDAATGAVAWVAPTGTVTAPLLAQDGWLIVAAAGTLAALRAEDGQPIWRRELGAQHAQATIEGESLYAPLDNGELRALDLKTGSDRWTRHFTGPTSEVLAFSDRVYAGYGDKNFYSFATSDGRREFRQRIGAMLRGRPVAEGARIFVTSIDNMVRAYDRNSGAMRWHRSVPFRPAAPVVIGSTVVVPGNSPEVQAFDLATGKPAGQIKLEQTLVMPPAFGVSDGVSVMAAFTGSFTGPWKLVLTAPPPPSAPPGSLPPAAARLPE
jgi:outer membrane protein assembly factor BamB